MPQDIRDGTLQKSKEDLFRYSKQNIGNTDDNGSQICPLLKSETSSNSKNTSDIDDDQRQDRQFKKCIERFVGDLFRFDKHSSDPKSEKI